MIDLTADLGGDLIDTSKLQESVNGLTGGLTTPAAYRADFDGLGLKSLNAPSLSAPGNCNFGVGLLKVTAPEGGSVTFTGVKATGAACTRGPFVFDENHKTEIVDLTGTPHHTPPHLTYTQTHTPPHPLILRAIRLRHQPQEADAHVQRRPPRPHRPAPGRRPLGESTRSKTGKGKRRLWLACKHAHSEIHASDIFGMDKPCARCMSRRG